MKKNEAERLIAEAEARIDLIKGGAYRVEGKRIDPDVRITAGPGGCGRVLDAEAADAFLMLNQISDSTEAASIAHRIQTLRESGVTIDEATAARLLDPHGGSA